MCYRELGIKVTCGPNHCILTSDHLTILSFNLAILMEDYETIGRSRPYNSTSS